MGVKLYIGNLPFGTTDQESQDHFSSHGTRTSAKVMAGRFTGRSRGFGLVEMSTQEEAEQVINPLHKTDIGGRIFEVNEARPLEEKRPIRSGPPNRP
jgi:RNA recognition motif-containing protein